MRQYKAEKLAQQEYTSNDGGRTHLLAFVPSLGGGGAEMHLLRLLNHFDRDRFRLSVAVSRSGGEYEGRLAPDVSLHVLQEDQISSSTVQTIRSVRPLRALIRRERPDIVFSVLDPASLALLLAVYGLPCSPRVVLSVQCAITARFRGQGWHVTKRLVVWLMQQFYHRADRIIALSTGVSKDITEWIPEMRGKIEVIHNVGVDESVVAHASEPLREDEVLKESPLLVACGRLADQKGYSYLLRALKQVRQSLPARLCILGEGPKRGKLEQMVNELGLEGTVWMPGFVKNPYRYMAAADAFVLSSLWEGFANVIPEAMASGAPVIATDCPHGPAEIIENETSGLLVQPADEEALAEAILRVLRQRSLRERLIREGRDRAKDFRADAIANEYADAFEGVLG